MSHGDPRWLRRLDALYALALRLYPRRFRDAWEGEMRQAFRDRCREVARGERKPLALLSEIVPDLAAGASREQFHHLQDASMFKRNLAIGLMVLLATLLAFQSRVSDATSAAHQWWTQRQERLAQASLHDYYVAVGETLAARSTPRDRAVAGLFLASAGDPRAQALWDQAVEAGDRQALWISITDCPVARCDADRALAALTSKAPHNAAVAQLRLDRAVRAGDGAAAGAALHDMATASGYSAAFTELTRDLMLAVEAVPVPTRLQRYYRNTGHLGGVPSFLAASVGARISRLPSMSIFPDYCRPPVAGAAAPDCLAAARILADGDALVARVLGLEVWRRLQADDGADNAALRQRIRDHRWLIQHVGLAWRNDIDTVREAWLSGRGEVEVYRYLMRERGEPIHAPDDFEVDPKYFQPDR